MKTISKQAVVPFRPEQVYALVNDVAAYPEFLPWCASAGVEVVAIDTLRATIEMQRGGLRKSFTTLNRLQPGKMIEVRLLEGPFRHLEGYWRFDPLGDAGCRISFDLHFEFSSRLVSLTLGPIFQQIARSLMDAFCQRAVKIYGQE